MEFFANLLQLFAGGLDISGIPKTPATESTLKIILNVVLSISGAVAVLMVVISGFRFITSQGNPNETAKARNGIVFSVIGILVTLFAFSLVNFVIFKVQ